MSGSKRTLVSKGFIVVAVVCAAILIVARMVLRPDYSHRNVRIFTEMSDSLARESFSPSGFLPEGTVEQPLMAGVMLRGETPFRYGTGTEEAQRAGRELENPIPTDDPDARAQGAEVYRVFCVNCHAADGGGRGSVVQRGMLPPPSLLGVRARELPDGELFHILTRGQGNMASYAAQVTPLQRWQVIAHIRSMQESQ